MTFCYLHAFLWLVINAVDTPGVEDILPAERPHDDVGTFQVSGAARASFSLRKKYFLTQWWDVLRVSLPGGYILNQ